MITKPRAARPANPLRVAHGILLVLATIGVLHATALVVVTLYRDHAWNQQAQDTTTRIQQLQREVNQLTTRRAKASTDERYLEELARQQGFVKKTETVTVPLAPNR